MSRLYGFGESASVGRWAGGFLYKITILMLRELCPPLFGDSRSLAIDLFWESSFRHTKIDLAFMRQGIQFTSNHFFLAWELKLAYFGIE
jgi:hypothetical protein